MPAENFAYVILGAGLSGLAVASRLGNQGVLLEREERAGGLVRGVMIGQYWFDQVLHLLYFPDVQTEQIVRDLLGGVLAPCSPTAWVHTKAGVARYPLQMNLSTLDPETVVQCISDLARATYARPSEEPRSLGAALIGKFGATLCDLFLFPYNRKLWKRDLDQLPASAVPWTMPQPDFAAIVRGALDSNATFHSYNAEGWYPRPAKDAALRTMEVLSAALACQVPNIRYRAEVCELDLDGRQVTFRENESIQRVSFESACVSTIPLPRLLSICRSLPDSLRRRAGELLSNRVWSVAFCILGPRPLNSGFWRYYADEAICFNRLIFMHEFDPQSAPADGWGLMAEITEPGENIRRSASEVIERASMDLENLGVLGADCSVIEARAWISEPAYVLQTPGLREVIEEANYLLNQHDVYTLGRYGRWEYSSMGQVLRDGFGQATDLLRKYSAPV